MTVFLQAFHLCRANLGLCLRLVSAGVLALTLAGGGDLYLGAAVNVQQWRGVTLIQLRLPFQAGGEGSGEDRQPPTRLVRPSERQRQIAGTLLIQCRFCPLRATRTALTLVLPLLLAGAGGLVALTLGFALLRALGDRYLGQPAGAGQALQAALGRLGAIVGWAVLAGVALGIGTLATKLASPFW